MGWKYIWKFEIHQWLEIPRPDGCMHTFAAVNNIESIVKHIYSEKKDIKTVDGKSGEKGLR